MVSEAALKCLETGEPRVIEIDLNDEVFGAGMPCGGSMRVYVEPILPNPVLWLMGHGRIVESLCEFACRLGFDVIVNDPQATAERFPTAHTYHQRRLPLSTIAAAVRRFRGHSHSS